MEKGYRAVTLRCEPTKRQKELLDNNIKAVSRMFEISRYDFQRALYHKLREEGFDVPSGVIADVIQRAGKTLTSNRILPVNKDVYKFVQKDGGGWFIEILLQDPKGKRGMRVLMPISKSDNDYYKDVIDGTAYPGIFYKEGDNWHLSISVPVETKYEKGRPKAFMGVDLNQRKHAASLYNPRTEEFEENTFFDLKPVDKKIKKIERRVSAIQRGKRKEQMTQNEKNKVRKLHKTINKIIEKAHGDFIADLVKIADKKKKKEFSPIFCLEDLKGITKQARKEYKPFNRWLHRQWCYQKFGISLETKGYPVQYEDPRDTSKFCHRCGSGLRIYGKHSRLVECFDCGLKDFSRDLNAARNLALTQTKQKEETP